MSKANEMRKGTVENRKTGGKGKKPPLLGTIKLAGRAAAAKSVFVKVVSLFLSLSFLSHLYPSRYLFLFSFTFRRRSCSVRVSYL